MSKSKIFFLALATVANFAGAATQGTLGATSTGTFTNTFVGAPRQVQVLGLQDATMNSSSGNVRNAFAGDKPGVSDKFCVVDTSGGAVRLTVSGTNPRTSDDRFIAKSTAGDILYFYQSLYTDSGAAPVGTSLDTTGFKIPSTSVRTAVASCNELNVVKTIVLPGAGVLPANGKTFTETMTIVATPE